MRLIRAPVILDQGPTLMTSFNVSSLFKGFVSTYKVQFQVYSFNMNLDRGTIQDHNRWSRVWAVVDYSIAISSPTWLIVCFEALKIFFILEEFLIGFVFQCVDQQPNKKNG